MDLPPGSTPPKDLTVRLRLLKSGNPEAADQVAEEVYSELRKLARMALSGEQNGQSLNPTLLVNEAFVRLLSGQPVEWQDRQHFFLLSARLMRRIITDHFRGKNAKKRPKGPLRIEIGEALAISENRQEEVLTIHEALSKLEEFDPRAAQVVELRYFGGRTESEIAQLLDIHVRTVRRDWLVAQAWLKQFLSAKAKTGAAGT